MNEFENNFDNEIHEEWNHTPYPEEPAPKKPKKEKKKGGCFTRFIVTVGTALLFGLVAGATILGVFEIKERLTPTEEPKIQSTIPSAEETTDSDKNADKTNVSASTSTDITKVIEDVMPSVVSITCTIQQQSYFYGTQETQGAGSGFIISSTKDKLYLATNNHVVDGATALTVAFCDGSTATAEIVGTDKDMDLAVISVNQSDIKEETSKVIKVAVLGDSDSLKVGQNVIAIGNALGYGQSVTRGVISAKDREVSFTDGTMSLLQTDAAINPGNSGGVLINESGEVIGINNAKLADTDVEGMGYAIPMSIAKDVLTELMTAKEIDVADQAFLGVVGKTIDETYSQALGMPSGIYVSQVVEGSPAETAGISAGDIITEFEGSKVSSMEGLKEKISRKKAGTKVKITLQRADQNGNYEEQKIEVTLGKKSEFEDAETSENQQDQQNQQNDQNQQNPYGNGNGNDQNGSDDSQDDQYIDPFEYFFGNGGLNNFFR